MWRILGKLFLEIKRSLGLKRGTWRIGNFNVPGKTHTACFDSFYFHMWFLHTDSSARIEMQISHTETSDRCLARRITHGKGEARPEGNPEKSLGIAIDFFQKKIWHWYLFHQSHSPLPTAIFYLGTPETSRHPKHSAGPQPQGPCGLDFRELHLRSLEGIRWMDGSFVKTPDGQLSIPGFLGTARSRFSAGERLCGYGRPNSSSQAHSLESLIAWYSNCTRTRETRWS